MRSERTLSIRLDLVSGSLTCTPMQNRDGDSFLSSRALKLIYDDVTVTRPPNSIVRSMNRSTEEILRREYAISNAHWNERWTNEAQVADLTDSRCSATLYTHIFRAAKSNSFAAESENSRDRSTKPDPRTVSGRPRLSRSRAHLSPARAGQLVAVFLSE